MAESNYMSNNTTFFEAMLRRFHRLYQPIANGMFLLALCLCLTPNADASNEFKQIFKHNGESIEVIITQKPFLASAHRINASCWKIDGTTPTGVDAFEVNPKVELEAIRIEWNGVAIPIASELFKDCYSPCLKASDADSYLESGRKEGQAIAKEGIMIRWEEKSNCLQVIMVSFDWASAPYFVIWNVGAHGVLSREIVLLGS